jgi:hypothetical protein
MRTNISLLVIAVYFLLVTASPSHSQSQEEQARLPYASIYKVLTHKLNAAQNNEARFKIESDFPDVRPENITLYIDSKSGKIPIKLNADGTFSFPIRDELLIENPFIITNQPKGTMNLIAVFSVKNDRIFPVEGGKVRYSELFVLEKTYPHITNEVSKLEDEAAINRQNIELPPFEFAPKNPNRGIVSVLSESGIINILPGSDGIVRIKYDPSLSKENPWVDFPPASESWEPNIWIKGQGVPKAQPAGARDRSAPRNP